MTAGPGLGADYAALRDGVGAHRVERDVVAVHGPDATAYLQGQLSQDIERLPVGGSVPSLVLEPDGKLCALVRVVHTADSAYLLDVDAGWGEAVLARLRRFRLRTKVELEAGTMPMVALRGAAVAPDGPPGTASIAGAGVTGPWWLPVAWAGATGGDVLGPGADALVPPEATWVGAEAFDALRIEAGVPVMGRELDERTIAAEAGLVEAAVSFTKGCYTGQELVARLDARGNRVPRRLCGLVLAGDGTADSPVMDPGALLSGSLWAPGVERSVGRCTSAAWCPGLGAVGALGYLHRSVEVPAELVWGPGETRPTAGGLVLVARALPLVGRE